MSATFQPFKIGQTVRILPDIHFRSAATDIYTVLRCNEPDSSNPSYVIQSETDHRQRRELHSRLRSVFADGGLASQVFVHRTST